jgi:hypothetical protein
MAVNVVGTIFLLAVAIWWLKRRKRRKAEAADREKEFTRYYKTYITDSNVRKKWERVYEKAAGRGERLMDAVHRRVEKSDIPNVSVSKRPMCLEGEAETRPFVVVENGDNMLKGYKVVFNACDFGAHLRVAWYVLFDITEVKNGAMCGNSPAEVRAVFDYARMVHLLIESEVKSELRGFNLDFTKVGNHTRGFLNIS